MPKAEISFEIVEHICVLSTGSKGWTKDLLVPPALLY